MHPSGGLYGKRPKYPAFPYSFVGAVRPTAWVLSFRYTYYSWSTFCWPNGGVSYAKEALRKNLGCDNDLA